MEYYLSFNNTTKLVYTDGFCVKDLLHSCDKIFSNELGKYYEYDLDLYVNDRLVSKDTLLDLIEENSYNNSYNINII